jgi:hypothetical protein
MPTKFNWRCPFCNHQAVIHDGEGGTLSSFRHEFGHNNKYGYQAIRGRVIVCPNDNCKEYTVEISLHNHVQTPPHNWTDQMPAKRVWSLIPESEAKVFPSYIPEAILADYREACLICNQSPKASATLSRRCLQGIIRDFWKIDETNLAAAVNAVRGRMDSDTWEAIDSVRQIGNIGAHMEEDINLLIDVAPEEARLLIGLIETLLSDWYVAKHDRQQRMLKLKEVAEQKKGLRKKPEAGG